ncbi:phytoene/squalene synthase family protein [Jannaschia donghaensis]|uniref:Dehydrosqualene synthase n=1 Tax=Jannaschia donghaensis TaxID=420998 RepID=A0A0M6YJL0_9RHOB|nr:phytoene/squalene synthase family protein [Jannaschia donghaensis]CTQ49457.1 Dehydrosqualene synthase [Jannaschia donghaensis]
MTGAALRAARADIAHGSRSFALAARLLPPGIRDDAVLLYAWCRHCDDAIDGQTFGGAMATVPDAAARLSTLRRLTTKALAGDPAPRVFAGLAEVCARADIPALHPQALLDGFAMDVAGRPFETMGDTLDYCYHAAGVIGVMMAMVMGVRAAPALDRASDLGIAFQLTNIARDVVEDAGAGRCYLPARLLDAHGLRAGDLTDPAAWPRARAAAIDLLDVAERYYASGRTGLADLPPRCTWGIAAARRIYRGIGAEIRRATPGSWAARVAVPAWRKGALAAVAMADGARARRATPAARDQLWSRPGHGAFDDPSS